MSGILAPSNVSDVSPPESSWSAPILDPAANESAQTAFRERLNKESFAFRHRLASHPLFETSRLADLGSRIANSKGPKRLVAFRAGRGSPGVKFVEFTRDQDPNDLIQSLPDSDILLRLSCVQEYDEAYRTLHQQIFEEVERRGGFALRQEIGWSSMTILLSSPGVVTPYHIDHQSNLLFQLRGRKSIWLFDPRDRRILGDAAIERYYCGDTYAADYREQLQCAGTLYELAPNDGIHNPPLGPHWVRNGSEVSISLSVNFSLRESEGRARVYQVNRYLRWIGLKPLPPGQSAARDWMKREPFALLTLARPRSLEELVRSGPNRLLWPARLLYGIWRRLRGPRPHRA